MMNPETRRQLSGPTSVVIIPPSMQATLALRSLSRPLASLPLHAAVRSASTNATQVPTSPPRETAGTTAGRSQSSDVAPIPESTDVAVTAEVVSGAPGMMCSLYYYDVED